MFSALRPQYKTKAAGPPNLGSQALPTAAAAKSYMRATTMSISAGVVHTTIRVGAAKSLCHRLLWSNALKKLFQAYEGSGKVDYEHSVRNEFATWKDGRRGFNGQSATVLLDAHVCTKGAAQGASWRSGSTKTAARNEPSPLNRSPASLLSLPHLPLQRRAATGVGWGVTGEGGVVHLRPGSLLKVTLSHP